MEQDKVIRTDDQTHVQGTISNLLDWCEGFLLDRRAQQLSDGTIQFYRKKLKKFLAWCHVQNITDIEQITSDKIRSFLVWLDQDHNRGGILAFIKTLRAFFNWHELETDHPSPMKRIKTPANTTSPLEPADIDAIRRMISKSDTRDKAIMLTLLDTGMRANELLSLDVADVNIITGFVYIRYGKGNKHRTVYVGRRTRQTLRKYIKHDGALFQAKDGGRLSYTGLRMIIQRRAKDARVKPPTIHSFRRLFALSMLRAGVDIYSLQLLMGHADLQVLRRYLKQTEQDTWAAHVKGSPVDKLI